MNVNEFCRKSLFKGIGKKSIFTCIFILSYATGYSQNKKNLPSLNIEDLKSNHITTDSIANTEGPTVISFWATWCKPCILELNEINDYYEDWQETTNVRVVAISVDDARSASKVPAFVNGRGWDFDIYLDKNSDLKRALNINTIPFTLLLDDDGSIVWQHNGYIPGDEEILYEELLNLSLE